MTALENIWLATNEKNTKEHKRNSFLFNSDRGQFYEFTSAHTEYRYEIEKSGKCVKEN